MKEKSPAQAEKYCLPESQTTCITGDPWSDDDCFPFSLQTATGSLDQESSLCSWTG